MKITIGFGVAILALGSLAGCGVFLPHDGAIVAVPKGTPVDATVAEDVAPAMLKAHRPDMGQGAYELGRILTVEKHWRPERNNRGVIVGQTIKMDALAKSGDKCWVLHFLVLEDHGNYEATRTYATIDGDQADRHRIDCSQLSASNAGTTNGER